VVVVIPEDISETEEIETVEEVEVIK